MTADGARRPLRSPEVAPEAAPDDAPEAAPEGAPDGGADAAPAHSTRPPQARSAPNPSVWPAPGTSAADAADGARSPGALRDPPPGVTGAAAQAGAPAGAGADRRVEAPVHAGVDVPGDARVDPPIVTLPERGGAPLRGESVPRATDGEIYDVLILGAGMAGLSAAHALLENDLDVLVVEARDRLGGRTWTDRSFAGFPLELGAEFVHGERAATWSHIDRLGLRTLRWEKEDDSWVRTADGGLRTVREARALDAAFELTRSWDLPDVPALPAEDFGSYLRRVGLDRTQIEYVRRIFGNAAGEGLRHLDASSVLDGFEARELDGGQDFRIVDGHGAIVEALGVGLDIDTRAVVRRVYWSDDRVSVETEGGMVYQARAAIVTLPVGVLQGGAVRFVPALPDVKARALAGLRMGPVMKLIYRFEEPLTPPHVLALYAAGKVPMWWSPSQGRDSDAVVWTALVSGDGAVDLLRHGEASALERGLAALARELDLPGLASADARLVNWPDDPFARGGYSLVTPGHRGAREELALPTPPLFWAGEATAPEARAATVHGALSSGVRAANEVRRALGLKRPPRTAAGGAPAASY